MSDDGDVDDGEDDYDADDAFDYDGDDAMTTTMLMMATLMMVA